MHNHGLQCRWYEVSSSYSIVLRGYLDLPFFAPWLRSLQHGRFRIFSCGTSKNGESYIVEWSGGNVQRTYRGFRNRSLGVVQFDTTKNRFLAAGDNFSIKFWDMDNVQLLTTVDADGGLPVSFHASKLKI